MKIRIVTLSLIALAASAAGAVTAQELKQPTVNLYRVLQNVEGAETTVVEGLFRVGPGLVGAACDYTAEVDIRDARGQTLQKDKWDGACQQQNGTPVAALETFHFGMPPGETFTVIVSVNSKDKPKEKHTRTLTVKSLPAGSVTSDLILGRQVGLVDSASASQWTIRRFGVGIRAASEIVVEPASPSLAYYLEVYPGKEMLSGIAWGVVRRPDGVELNRFQLQKLDSVKTFRPVAGKVSLSGLAPGAYNFEVQLALADTTISASHPFEMMAEVVATTAGTAANGYFSTVSDEDVEKVFGSASVWLTQKAQSEVFKNLTPAGKREYLNRTFGSEMPTPSDNKETSSIDAFVTRSLAVDQRFSERAGRGTLEGWKTDRGKIYMLHGEPNSLISRPSPRSGSPYEIFHYQIGKGLVYVFMDDTRMRNYRLIWTNDPNEQGVVNGLVRLSIEAQEDLQRLGIRAIDQ
jgi:GWxTD domain-containing protein